MLVFVDTSGWLAVAIKRDRNHSRAKDYFESLLREGSALLTSNYVLSETYTRLRYDVGHKEAMEFHKIAEKAKGEKKLKAVYVDEEIEREAWRIFEKYSDQLFSFVDCTSFIICSRNHVNEVFAFDEDFTIVGFNVKP